MMLLGSITTMSPHGACQCDRFLSGVDLNNHTICAECGDFKYMQVNSCEICQA